MLDDNEAHAANDRVITVIGYSFAFEYRYDSDGGFTRNDGLYVPVGKTIVLHMVTPLFTPGTKTLEVIHGFWVPEWGVKQDATPGVVGKTVGTTYVTPTRIGDYEVQCTELCGSGHGEMHFKNIHVLSQAAFDKWLTQAKADAAEGSGGGRRRLPASPSSTARAAAAATRSRRPSRAARRARRSMTCRRTTRRAKQTSKTEAADLTGFIKESIVDPNAYIAKGYAPDVMPTSFGSSLEREADRRSRRLPGEGRLGPMSVVTSPPSTHTPAYGQSGGGGSVWTRAGLVARAALDDHRRRRSRSRSPALVRVDRRLAVVAVRGHVDVPDDRHAARLPARHRLLRLLGASTSSARRCPRGTPTTAPTAGATTSRSTPTTR